MSCMKVDEQLIRQCIQGNRKAQIRLYDLCYGYMMSICIRYCKDKHEAGSRLNLSFLKVLQHLEQFDQSGSFKAWVSRITLRSIIDEFRSQQRHYQHHVYYEQFTSDMDQPYEADSHLAYDVDIDYLMSVINKLPEMPRQVFNLFAIDGYGHKEIADLLGISEGTSKWHVHEARKKIREALVKDSKTASLK